MKKLNLLLITGLVILQNLCYAAEGDVGTASLQFLKLGVGARPIGMGETFVAVSDDANSIYWNPAGIAKLKKPEITLSHNSLFVDINFQNITYIQPVNRFLSRESETLGLTLLYLHMNEIEGYDIDQYGSPLKINNFQVYDFLFITSYALKIRENTSVGLNFKLIQEQLASSKVNTYNLDAGFLHKIEILKRPLHIGFSVQNIGADVKFIEKTSPQPLNLKFGASYKVINEKLTLGFEINKPVDYIYKYSIGAEYSIPGILSIRTGYNTRYVDAPGFSLGLGIIVSGWNLDYAYMPYHLCPN